MKIAACLRPMIQAQSHKDLCVDFECTDRWVSCKIHLQSCPRLCPWTFRAMMMICDVRGWTQTQLQGGLGSLLESNRSNNKDFESQQRQSGSSAISDGFCECLRHADSAEKKNQLYADKHRSLHSRKNPPPL